MTLRVVAIPLIAAICLGSPAMASPSTDDEQQVARPRRARSRRQQRWRQSRRRRKRAAATRRQRWHRRRGSAARRRDDGEQRAADRSGDRDAERQRCAVPRDRDTAAASRDSATAATTRRSSSRATGRTSTSTSDRRIADRATTRRCTTTAGRGSYYRWSPIGYAPWSLIYGSIGFSNFGFYGGGRTESVSTATTATVTATATAPDRTRRGRSSRLRHRRRPPEDPAARRAVFVDGYYAGLVDDFDGTFQSLRLEAGRAQDRDPHARLRGSRARRARAARPHDHAERGPAAAAVEQSIYCADEGGTIPFIRM